MAAGGQLAEHPRSARLLPSGPRALEWAINGIVRDSHCLLCLSSTPPLSFPSPSPLLEVQDSVLCEAETQNSYIWLFREDFLGEVAFKLR